MREVGPGPHSLVLVPIKKWPFFFIPSYALLRPRFHMTPRSSVFPFSYGEETSKYLDETVCFRNIVRTAFLAIKLNWN